MRTIRLISTSVLVSASVALCVLITPGTATAGEKKNDRVCEPRGSYSFEFTGTSFTPDGPVPLAEIGEISLSGSGELSSLATLTFFFENFQGQGPLWLALEESMTDGELIAHPDRPCLGTMEFLATGIVVKTSNPALVPVGVPFYADLPRSLDYSVGGKGEEIRIVSTSPGTIASGTAVKIKKPD